MTRQSPGASLVRGVSGVSTGAPVRLLGGAPSARHPGGGCADDVSEVRLPLVVCVGVVLVRASTLWMPLRADEGGYLLVARQWHAGGEFLYGGYSVDRPPLLLLLFRVAALGAWDGWVRVLAVPFAVLLVLAAWRAGRSVGGARGGRWACVVAAGMVCSPAVAADQADGELFATALVMAAVALALQAWGTEDGRRAAVAAVAAGALAVAAPLVKQNALEGGVVLAVLVAVGLRRGGPSRDRAVVVAAAAAAGAALVLVPVTVWLWTGAGLVAAWVELVAFRGDALEVVWSARPRATVVRALQLVGIAAGTGLAGVLLTWWSAVRGGRVPRTPQVVAVTALVPVGVLGIVAGGSFWPSYLLQLAPVVVLVVGALAGSAERVGTWSRGWVRVVVGTAAVGCVVEQVVYATVPAVWFQQRTGEWLSASSAPGDTAVVAYGNPSVLEAADLASPYPYLWSVPVRTLDPDLDRLRATLAGGEAPAWVVEMHPLDSWGIDDGARLRVLVQERYRVVAEVCGRRVHLREDLERTLAAPVRC